MNKKTSNTLLHEWCQAKKLPPPTYTIEEIPGGHFRCKVRAAGETAEGVSTSKKLAKLESCTSILNKLNKFKKTLQEKSTKDSSIKSQDIVKSKENSSKSQCPDAQKKPKSSSKKTALQNYVGELNEYASKRKLDFPVYEAHPTTLKTGECIVTCSFLRNQALGKGSNKKDAKQESAKNMLKLYLDYNETEKSAAGSEKSNKKSNVKQKQKEPVISEGLTKDLQNLVSVINNLGVLQKQGSGSSSRANGNRKMKIVINLEN